MFEIRKIMTALLLGFLPIAAFAQTPYVESSSLSGHFFVSVLAGVIIATGVQFLLSNLAIALGISAIGDVTELDNNSKQDNNSENRTDTKSLGRKLSTGFGIFTTVTMSISLFIATWLAIDLSLANTVVNGAIIGVVIWALFFVFALFIDMKLTTAICGNLLSFIQKGAASAGSAVKSIFEPSDQAKAKTLVTESVKAIRDEVRREFDTTDIDKKIKQYIDRATDTDFSAKDIRKELETLINQIEIEEQYVSDDPDATKKLIIDIASKQPTLDENQKKKISATLDDIKASVKDNDSHQKRATAAFDKLSPGDEAQGKAYRDKLLAYLDETNREELSSDELQKDIETIFDNPASARRIINDRVNKLDRDSVKALLATHKNMDEGKADKLLSAYDKVMAKISDAGNSDDSQQSNTPNLPAKRGKAETAIQQWFDRMQRPELRYRHLKSDFMAMLDSPSEAPEILMKRLKQMDERSVRALLTNNDRLTERDVDEYMAKYDEARTEVLSRLEKLELEANKRINQLKTAALKEAEAVRATAASAAWWLFISAVVSLGASSIAGALASGLL